jgi:hypothetical protein
MTALTTALRPPARQVLVALALAALFVLVAAGPAAACCSCTVADQMPKSWEKTHKIFDKNLNNEINVHTNWLKEDWWPVVENALQGYAATLTATEAREAASSAKMWTAYEEMKKLFKTAANAAKTASSYAPPSQESVALVTSKTPSPQRTLDKEAFRLMLAKTARERPYDPTGESMDAALEQCGGMHRVLAVMQQDTIDYDPLNGGLSEDGACAQVIAALTSPEPLNLSYDSSECLNLPAELVPKCMLLSQTGGMVTETSVGALAEQMARAKQGDESGAEDPTQALITLGAEGRNQMGKLSAMHAGTQLVQEKQDLDQTLKTEGLMAQMFTLQIMADAAGGRSTSIMPSTLSDLPQVGPVRMGQTKASGPGALAQSAAPPFEAGGAAR